MGAKGSWVLAHGAVFAVILLVGSGSALGQTDRDALERQLQEQLREQRREAQSRPATLAPQAGPGYRGPVAGETPCWSGLRLVLDAATPGDSAAFAWLLQDLGEFESACLGAASLQALRHTLDSRLLARGFATSRVEVPPQNLKSGQLQLRLHVGRVGDIVERRADGSLLPVPPGVLPLQPGAILNLRALEQGIENLASLPSRRAQFAIEPGTAPDTSQVVVAHAGGRSWRAWLDADNAGAADYGRWQLRAGGAVEIYALGAGVVSLNHQRTRKQADAEQQLSSLGAQWAWGWHQLSASLQSAQHVRPIQGATSRYRESGSDRTAQLGWQWTAWRSAQQRWSLGLSVQSRRASTSVAGIELLLQRRRTTEAEASVEGQWRAGPQTASVQWSQRRTLRNDSQVEGAPPPPSKPRHHAAAVQLTTAFANGVQHSAALYAQAVRQATAGPDLKAVGGAGTVRGYELREQAVAEQALWLRQDLIGSASWLRGDRWAAQWQAGLDWGRVRSAGPAMRTPDVPHRAGLSLGLRGQWALGESRQARGELGAAWPLTALPDRPGHKPVMRLQVGIDL